MPNTHDSPSASCPVDCPGCASGSEVPRHAPLRGGRLALAAIGVFLAPLALSIAGAAVLRGSPVRTFAGAAGGLFAGVFLAGLLARRLRGRREPTA